jgi:hypothetical protein
MLVGAAGRMKNEALLAQVHQGHTTQIKDQDIAEQLQDQDHLRPPEKADTLGHAFAA